jgi:phage-related protein
MPTPTFSPVQGPSRDSSDDTTLEVFEAEFGDMYGQRTPVAPLNEKDELQLTWDVISWTDAKTIRDQLLAWKGSTAFYYTQIGESVAKKYVCKKVRRVWGSYNHCRLEATFKRVYDL